MLTINGLMRPQNVNKDNVLGRINDDIYENTNTDQQKYKKESSPSTSISTVVTIE